MSGHHLLLCAPTKDIRDALTMTCAQWTMTETDNWTNAWNTLHVAPPQLLAITHNSDIEAQLPQVLAHFPNLPVLVVGNNSDLTAAVACVKLGAIDFLVPPIDQERLQAALNTAVTRSKTNQAAAALARTVDCCVTRADLLQDLRSPDDDPWLIFYQTYAGMIAGWARAMGCPSGMEQDVVQDVTLKLRTRIESFDYDRDKGSFRGYLKTAVRWAVTDLQRRESRTPRIDDQWSPSDEPGGSVVDQLPDHSDTESLADDKVYLRTLVYHALRLARTQVNERTAMIFERYRIKAENPERVASELGVKVQTVYEAARRFREEHLLPSFLRILAAHGESQDRPGGMKLLGDAIEHCVRDDWHYEMTLTNRGLDDLAKRSAALSATLCEQPPPEGEGAALLVLTQDEELTWQGRWQLLAAHSTVGRLEGLTVSLPSHDVSGEHLHIDQRNGNWLVTDLGSKNGTFLNGRVLPSHRQTTLHSGDVIGIADVVMLVHIAAA